MIPKEHILTDDFDDDFLPILNAMAEQREWGKEMRNLKAKLLDLIAKHKYITFKATNPTRYHVSWVGSSLLYDVPLYKQGHLKQFRGQRVRVLCSGSGSHSTREISVGFVSESPAEKVIESLERNYSFPEFAQSLPIRYKSPRFMVLDVPSGVHIRNNREDSGFIDLRGYTSIVVDGKLSAPIGTLKSNRDGSIEARLLGHQLGGRYESIQRAIAQLQKWYR